MESNLLRYFKTTDIFLARVQAMSNDIKTLRFSKEQLKERYNDIFKASSHLFDAILSGRMDRSVTNMMVQKLKKFEKNPEDIDEISKETGRELAKTYLEPIVGKQPVLTKEREDFLINKVKEENKKEAEKLEKVNRGELDPSVLKTNSRKVDLV